MTEPEEGRLLPPEAYETARRNAERAVVPERLIEDLVQGASPGPAEVTAPAMGAAA
jgi:hypothetical protein